MLHDKITLLSQQAHAEGLAYIASLPVDELDKAQVVIETVLTASVNSLWDHKHVADMRFGTDWGVLYAPKNNETTRQSQMNVAVTAFSLYALLPPGL